MSRSEKLLELAARKFKESNALELERSAQNDYSSPGPSGVTRTVKQMNDGGSDSDLEWEDFDCDDSVKDRTYQCDSNDEGSGESNAERVLVIDESMVPFRGRLSFRQYVPNKTHRYGVKLYKLCTSSGYTYNLKVYTGKGDTQPELGHAQSIVLKLLEDVNKKKGRILYRSVDRKVT
ncbi:unnamed protein product [Acanthoscelides obtectus]|uniref:PiggyBac transposable element-derived protein domain-containing protein n=1 Tax=Acanthoscelides obtectus TaxID=200917 RepID=A0A9P0KDH4_ACAOB|nr:unnamed protein product [Acanthoscelides obtectus]CAK1680372.1 PiggyBac transposable element-derived protein 4 [Acanthoscelides obtectus]